MTSLMQTLDIKKSFLLLLITAFLMLQWSSSHIHLSQQHSHGDGEHGHSLQLHAHQLDGHHPDAIDTIDVAVDERLHHNGDNAVLELDYNCTCSFFENVTSSAILILAFNTHVKSLSLVQGVPIPETTDFLQGYLDRQPPGQRAPPQRT